MYEGIYTAIVTPFKKGKVDFQAFEKLLDLNIKGGVHGIVPCGTTGESPTLDEGEYRDLIEVTVRKMKGKGRVIAGAGSNSTLKAVKKARMVRELGADAALVVTPYYNKPTQRGLYLHYEAIAREADIPLFIYNVPGRTGVNILPETLERLSRIKNIAGVKEASGNLVQIAQIRKSCPGDFSLLSGDDQLFLPSLSIGGDGIISVASNVIPEHMCRVFEFFKKARTAEAENVFLEILKLIETLFIETNPIPVKAALHMMGHIENELRLPLCPIDEKHGERLREEMKRLGLI